MKVTQIVNGRFHHFHLARQLEKNELLNKIYTSYPKFKLNDEVGIPKNKIISFPWIHAPFMKRKWLYLNKFEWLNKRWAYFDHDVFDRFVSSKIKDPTILIALSGSGLYSGSKAKQLGGKYICDRGSSHIKFQNDLLKEEYLKWGLEFKGIDLKLIEKEEAEYNLADFITVPSNFVMDSFIKKGVPKEKIIKVPYGARFDRFMPVSYPVHDKFRVLWVGGISIRKGFMYALQAFQNIDVHNKEFVVIGTLFDEMKQFLNEKNTKNVKFLGNVPNDKLPEFYSSSNVFVLSSIEEGLAMVLGEALACGCPVIASRNTGASDLFDDGKEGFILPIRSIDKLTEKMQILADDVHLQSNMSKNALIRIQNLNGWNSYGDKMSKFIKALI